MKLLMVTRETASDRRYGLGKSLSPVLGALERQGVETRYLTQEDLGVRSVRVLKTLHRGFNRILGRLFEQTDLHSMSWLVLERLNMGRLAAKVAHADGFTHVHCHDPIIAAGYRWFARFRRGGLLRYGVTEHGFGSYAQAIHEDGAVLGPSAMRRLRDWERRVLARAHWVLVPADGCAEQLARDLGRYPRPSHWHVIPHPRPEPNVRARAAARAELGWAADPLYIIAVGRFVPLKCLPTLVRACARLERADWRLVLVGDGDSAPLQALADSLGIGNRIGFAVTDDIGLYYSAADIYVSTSSTESFGLANLEALCCGLPSLCTAVGCTPEVLGSGAWLIPPENLPALTSALQAMAEDADLRRFWSRRARAWTASWPGPDEIAQAYLSMYQGTSSVRAEREVRPVPSPSSIEALGAQAAVFSTCPLPPRLPLPQVGSALVLAPHSDDETLGCGGILALLRRGGWRIKVLVMTDGALGDPLDYLGGRDLVAHRQNETRTALRALGVDDVEFLGEPDGALMPHRGVAERLARVVDAFAPDWLLAPPVLDFHRDHVNTSLLALDLWQLLGCRERLFFYEIWQPLPVNWIVDVTPVLESKRLALAAYELPMRYQDYSQAFEGMMRYRGLYLGPNSGTHAEALLELKADSWRPVVESLMRLRASQEREPALA
jgi:glycosyltransferase involved in cell wall biosynthesis/LmbE family N-acetylglucosaminyl deacetylase